MTRICLILRSINLLTISKKINFVTIDVKFDMEKGNHCSIAATTIQD
jgi:hypothetical protein